MKEGKPVFYCEEFDVSESKKEGKVGGYSALFPPFRASV